MLYAIDDAMAIFYFAAAAASHAMPILLPPHTRYA